jgi:hypothetical protein
MRLTASLPPKAPPVRAKTLLLGAAVLVLARTLLIFFPIYFGRRRVGHD